jgi:hypothetical protein
MDLVVGLLMLAVAMLFGYCALHAATRTFGLSDSSERSGRGNGEK